MIKAIIIEDNESYRNKLRKKTETLFAGQMEISGEAASVNEGLELIKNTNPGLVFLDIELKKSTAFDLLERIGNINFDIIFTTAHEEYALRAIKFSALDYLLKPIDDDQLITAVEKHKQKRNLHDNTGHITAIVQKQVEALFADLHHPGNQGNRVALPVTNGKEFIQVKRILYGQAEDKITRLRLLPATDKIEYQHTVLAVWLLLKECEELFSDYDFMRIHKSFIINLNNVVRYIGSNSSIIMANGDKLDVSDTFRSEFLRRWKRK